MSSDFDRQPSNLLTRRHQFLPSQPFHFWNFVFDGGQDINGFQQFVKPKILQFFSQSKEQVDI